jgi:hypothetical protein
MKKTCLAFMFVILSSISFGSLSVGWGDEVTVFGPKTYTRGTGNPQLVTGTFAVSPSLGDFLLIVKNGNQGKDRISSARILVNNLEVLSPSYFNQNIDLIKKPVTLAQTNVIGVELQSKPGSSITVSIVGKRLNTPPVVNAGPDVTVKLPDGAVLHGAVSDDGLPGPLVTTWGKLNGPGTVTFGSASSVNTTAHFSQSGTYLLRLTANDGVLSTSDDMTVTVVDAPLTLGVTLDTARTAAVLMGPDGGEVTTTAADGTVSTLTVPPGALVSEQTISITPVLGITGLPLSGELVAAVHFTPDGLQLARPATLTLTLPGPVDRAGLLGFVFDDTGTNFEVVSASVDGATLALQVSHFSTAGTAQGALQDFAQQITPMLNALPSTLPPTQVTSLVSQLVAWIERFGFEVCTGTSLCQHVFQISLDSLTLHRQQACTQAATFVQNGEPFLAREALKSVMAVASKLLELSVLAEQVGVTGFQTQLDLTCVGDSLGAIINLAWTQALANPRPGLLLLLVDIAGDAAELSLDELAQQALDALRQVLVTLLDRANQTCLTDPDAGEVLIDLVQNIFPDRFLDGVEPGLDARFHVARAGCRVRIDPPETTIGFSQQVQFTGSVVGLSPSGVTWSVRSPTGGNTIDSQTGLFTAGQINGTFFVAATSMADVNRFKTAKVTVAVPVQVTVSPPSATVSVGGAVQFSATVAGATNTAVTWSTTDPGGVVSSTGRYTAGTTAGSFRVRAISVAEPGAFADATVTISSLSHGVTRDSSLGTVAVHLISVPSNCGEAARDSPVGATAWSDTLSCEGSSAGDRASGVATTSFTESYAGGDLVAVTASSSGSATSVAFGTAAASGYYTLEFSVAQTTEVSIDAQVTGGGHSNLEFLFSGPGILIDDRDGGSVNRTVMLTAGRYLLQIAAVAVADGPLTTSGSASFSLNLAFGP